MALVPMSRRSALALAAGLPISLLALQPATATEPVVRYTMTAFTNANETDLYVYESTDALNFDLLSGPAYRPPSGLLRDPCLFRHADGAYYLAYTTGWEGQTIGFARSTDRITWHHLYDFTVPIPGVTSTWAPEWFVDARGRVNVIVSLSDGYRFTAHLMTALDPGLRLWGPLIPMAGLAAHDDTSYGYIDTTVVRHEGRYFAFTKHETTKYIELAVADDPLGPYVFVAKDDWANWGTPREGQSIIRLPGGGWRIFFDAYTEGRYLYSDSYDNFRTWTPPTELPNLSGTVRHFTVFPETGHPPPGSMVNGA
ncbi:hypothetical protein GCM10023319_02130 [Nocardia iowensis]